MGKMDKLFDGADHDYYPAWVCSSCGAKYGRRRCGTACWHVGTCGICGIEASVTEPRDFGHLQTDWRERYEQEAPKLELMGERLRESRSNDGLGGTDDRRKT